MATVYYVAASLDGFIADADGRLEWLLQFGDPADVDPGAQAFMSGVGAVAMGARTYRWLLDDPAAADSELVPGAPPTWVITHQDFPTADGVRFASGDVRPIHATMSAMAGAKDIWIMGGGEVAGQFFDAGLLDELALTIVPVTLGAGTPVFPRAITRPLRPISITAGGMGAILARYRLR